MEVINYGYGHSNVHTRYSTLMILCQFQCGMAEVCTLQSATQLLLLPYDSSILNSTISTSTTNTMSSSSATGCLGSLVVRVFHSPLNGCEFDFQPL